MQSDTMPRKSGYAALIGKPNSGKSSLMNAILGTKLSIVTRKAQTTRRRVQGIYTENNTQIVFLDNPGLVEPKYKLQKAMMDYVDDSFGESDVIVLVIDIAHFYSVDDYFDPQLLEKLKLSSKPKVAVLNKIDLLRDIKNLLPFIQQLSNLSIFDDIIPISAKKKASIDVLISVLSKYMPEGEYFYDEEYLSSQNERFFVSEIIREHIFKFYSEELPYSTDVQITKFDEREIGKWFIAADIVIERQSQKKIMIGENGSKIKMLGERARHDIEKYLQMPVYLELFVKVREKWRNDDSILKTFGY
jgi:GTP-binding protein Era